MAVKQLSVFLENKEGRLQQVFNLLKEADINVISASLADTKDYGVLRTIVSDNEKAQKVLHDNGISSKLVDIIAINIPHTVGSLSSVLNAIADAGINVVYMYGLSTGDQGASIAIKTNAIPGTEKALAPLDIQYYEDKKFAGILE